MPDDTHDCPGGCGARVPVEQLACKNCWFRLPRWLRAAVTAAWRRRRRFPRDVAAVQAHRAAVDRAVEWYRDNPLGMNSGMESGGKSDG